MKNSDIEPKKGIEEGKGQEKPEIPVKRKYEKQPLSIREKKFIKAFTTVGSDTYGLPIPSAREAGYVESRLEHTTRRLMANPKVLAAIDEVYAKRLQGTPTNIARVMSNLDNTEAIALKNKAMPTLTKVAELRGKYLDLWNNNPPPDQQQQAKMAAQMSAEDKRISLLVVKCLTAGSAGSPQALSELRDMIIKHPELVFPKAIKKAVQTERS